MELGLTPRSRPQGPPNGGVPGVNGQSFDDIEKLGRDQWLDELAEELRNETYQPRPVRRVYIPKGDGKQRPLGIPCIRDRVVQTATMLVLEPIFEADLEPEQHAYRPERSALDAVRQVERQLRSGHTEVVDADLSGYFDSIPPCPVNEVGVPADQRRPRSATDQAVAGSTGGRDGREREPPSNDPEQGPGDWQRPRGSDLTVVRQMCTCGAL